MGTLQNHTNWCLPLQGIETMPTNCHPFCNVISFDCNENCSCKKTRKSKFKGIIHPYIHPANNHSVCVNQSITVIHLSIDEEVCVPFVHR